LLPLLPKSPDLDRRRSKPKLDLRGASCCCADGFLLSGIAGILSWGGATPPLGVRGLLLLTMLMNWWMELL